MQVTGMSALGIRYTGAIDAFRSILRTEGIRGLYKGLWPNLRKFSLGYLTCAVVVTDGTSSLPLRDVNCSQGCAEHCYLVRLHFTDLRR